MCIRDRLSSGASCREECASDDACRAYTWLSPSAAAPPTPRLHATPLTTCWGVHAYADEALELLPRAGAASGRRGACSPPPSPPGVAELGPDSNFYISGEQAANGMWAIFFGVMRSLGQTIVLVAGGLWLGRAGVINKEGAKALSAIGMNLLIPALLFVRVLEAATVELLASAWLAAVLPFLYVPCGVLLGVLCVLITRPGAGFEKGMIAAVTFGNSTGLPIIILSVVNDALMTPEIRALTERLKGCLLYTSPSPRD